uniref:protein-tyrosine-phosphatase n=1 Tax=Stegastes partitus TaxID=144197 RepID=A0A3B4ZM23_9TELE
MNCADTICKLPQPSCIIGPEHFQYSEPVISKVTDYIYVGNLNAASVPGEPDVPDALGDGPALKQRCFEDINECINASTEKRKRVLVHCRDGFSLAPTCIIQYLMVKQNMRLIAAYELLRAKYPVNIRECHQNVLVSLERALRPGGNVDPECFKQAISRKVAWT